MTVDSTYLGAVTYENDDETEYPFEIESIGADAVQVWVVDAEGNRTRLSGEN
jgi:hypothetical protein